MVDQLLFADDTTARTSFIVSGNNVLNTDNIFQEGGILENIAQTAAAHAGFKARAENRSVQPGFIGAVKDFNVLRLPATDDKLETEVTVESQIFNVTIIYGKVWCHDTLVASCEMRIFIQEDDL